MDVIDEADDSATAAVGLQRSGPPPLTLSVAQRSYTVTAEDSPITIGRGFPAQIAIDDARISRNHVRIEAQADRWTGADRSTNGTFISGARESFFVIADGMTIHLGNPNGIPVTFAMNSTQPDVLHTPIAAATVDADVEDTPEGEATDPGIAHAGAEVARRRRELDIAQRTLAREKIINAGALIAFEKGRSWPREATQAKLENILGWERGTITRLRQQGGSSVSATGVTHVAAGGAAAASSTAANSVGGGTTTTVEALLLVGAADLALDNIKRAIGALPDASDPRYGDQVAPVLADLRRLNALAANAARGTRGAPEVAVVLSRVRRTYRDLMLDVARSPQATRGQRLFAARHRAELTVEEAANAAGVSPADIDAVEADQPLPADVVSAIETLLLTLDGR